MNIRITFPGTINIDELEILMAQATLETGQMLLFQHYREDGRQLVEVEGTNEKVEDHFRAKGYPVQVLR